MTKEEFEKGYCERSGITLEEYRNEYELISLPCSCGHTTCDGWAAVSNTPIHIKIHSELYNS